MTGLNLGDLDPARGMSTLVQWTTRTWPSSCSNHGTELFFTNDDGLYLLDMFGLVPEPGGDSHAVRQGRGRSGAVHPRCPPGTKGALARPSPPSDNAPGAVRLQSVEREQARYHPVHPGDEHHPRVHQPAVHLPRAELWLLPRRRAARAQERRPGRHRCRAQVDPARRMGIVELEQRVLSMLVVEQAFICQNINTPCSAWVGRLDVHRIHRSVCDGRR